MVQLYILFSESTPTSPLVKSTDHLLDKENGRLIAFIESLETKLSLLVGESYEGFFDSNVDNFLNGFNEFEKLGEDYYPNSTLYNIISYTLVNTFFQRLDVENTDSKWHFFNQQLDIPQVEQIAIDKSKDANSNFLLLSHDALKFSETQIEISDTKKQITTIDIAHSDKELYQWFVQNRLPARIFNLNLKHGECNKGMHKANKGDEVSPLRRTKEEAQFYLNHAIGNEKRILFYFDVIEDKEYYIEFKYENGTQYHGFHIESTSNRVPADIRTKLKQYQKDNWELKRPLGLKTCHP
jgi:hypothetical protein